MSVRGVFFSCGATTIPVLRVLAARFAVVVPFESSVDALARQGVRAVPWTAFETPDDHEQVAVAVARIAPAWSAALAHRAERLCVWAGRRRADAFLPALDVLVRERLPEHLRAVALGRRMAASGRLAAIVTHEDVTGLVRGFIAGARAGGVPAVHVPHGVYSEEAVAGADVHGALRADVLAVGGPVQRHWFARRGVAPERIVVTGNPCWDAWHRVRPAAPGALGLPPGPVVALATSWWGGESAHGAFVAADQERRTRIALAALARVQARRPDVRLVVKLHPSAPPAEGERVAAWARAAGAAPALVTRDRLAEVLAASALLVTLPSTIAVESVLAGTPAIAVGCRYAGEAVVEGPLEAEGLGTLALGMVEGWKESAEFARRRRAFAALWDGPADGRAATRVATLVEALAGTARTEEAGHGAG
jgi:hypothetical protein